MIVTKALLNIIFIELKIIPNYLNYLIMPKRVVFVINIITGNKKIVAIGMIILPVLTPETLCSTRP